MLFKLSDLKGLVSALSRYQALLFDPADNVGDHIIKRFDKTAPLTAAGSSNR